jgi:hypothetical protein
MSFVVDLQRDANMYDSVNALIQVVRSSVSAFLTCSIPDATAPTVCAATVVFSPLPAQFGNVLLTIVQLQGSSPYALLEIFDYPIADCHSVGWTASFPLSGMPN